MHSYIWKFPLSALDSALIDENTLVLYPVPVTVITCLIYMFLFFLMKQFTPLVNAEEMDWDKNGTVTFKEFLFAFTRWVGIDNEDDDEDDEEEE
jgi:hypothetical protein